MASQTEENYLKSLYTLTSGKKEVNITELSSLLKVSMPTVNSMIKNLERQGLVNYEKYKPISLTEKGKKEATLILRKHRLTEMYLVNKMGFGWEEVHDIAEQVEHIHSNKFFDRMDELLEFPKIDPHGSQIPDKNGNLEWKMLKKLSECNTGERVKLIALSHSSNDFLIFLNNHDLHLGTELEIRSVENFDNSMVVSYKNHPKEMLSQ
ncbi:MAG: metal-dependent transcriptional regulator, partial [Paludibacter sp.]|nr:metal-dependent transcriptional regulator [Paludibacter sp.]